MQGIGARIAGFARARLSLLALLALLTQTIAPLSPMPSGQITTIEGLTAALADLCRPGVPDDGKGAPRDHKALCQICLTLAVSGQFITPSLPPQPLPLSTAAADWRPSTPHAPALARAVGVQPRGPPASV